MIDKLSHIPELYQLHHRKDSFGTNVPFDYENKLFSVLFSNVMFKNPNLSSFLSQMQGLWVIMLESNLVMRNFWNYTVSKYNNHFLD